MLGPVGDSCENQRRSDVVSLVDWLGIEARTRSCTAVVGAGGKTTTTFGLAAELADRGDRTIVSTTTKMGRDQTGGLVVVGLDRTAIDAALGQYGTCLVVDSSRTSDRKISGLTKSEASQLWLGEPRLAMHLVLEADGARKHNVKAPAPHEPVIPSVCTHVIAVIGADALNRVIEDQAHRPLRVAAVAGLRPYDRLTALGAWRLLTDRQLGSAKDVPAGAWFGVLINKVTPTQRDIANELFGLLTEGGTPTLVSDFSGAKVSR